MEACTGHTNFDRTVFAEQNIFADQGSMFEVYSCQISDAAQNLRTRQSLQRASVRRLKGHTCAIIDPS